MKQRKAKPLKVPKPKGRVHKTLFDPELPFKPKAEKNKKKYTRKSKHKEQP